MVNMMERAFTNWGMAIDIEVNTLMDKNMAKVCSSGKMEAIIKVNSKKTKWMAEVITLGLMALSTMVIGSNQKCMGKEFLN